MIRIAILLAAIAALLHAQNRGSEIFRTTCGVAYCHGQEGAAGRAPQLAGTSLSAAELTKIIREGTKAGMPSFAEKLKPSEINTVAQYILSLSAPAMHAATPVKPSPTAQLPGRALFFDAVRMGGCGRCHELEDRGNPVGPDLRKSQATDLRAVTQTRIVTAAPQGEAAFPAIVREQKPERVLVYDLTSPLPVLRTFTPANVKIINGGTWSHPEAVRNYSDADLESIREYLKAVR